MTEKSEHTQEADDVPRADDRASPRAGGLEPHIVALRAGHGANCSSIGSVIDTLFITALAGGAIFAAVAAALEREEVQTVAPPTSRKSNDDELTRSSSKSEP
jgi:hypothetical protein